MIPYYLSQKKLSLHVDDIEIYYKKMRTLIFDNLLLILLLYFIYVRYFYTDSNKFIVRIIFETTSKIDDSKKPDENSTLAYSEIVKDPTLYQNFYEKLSKSIFIEEQRL